MTKTNYIFGIIWNHHVIPGEVEECFEGPHKIMPHKKAKSEPKYSDRYAVIGHTAQGRKLMIIVRHKGGRLIRTITSWEVAP